MKTRFLVLFLFATVMVNCDRLSSTQTSNAPQVGRESNHPALVDKEQAIKIATTEALKEQQAIDKYDVKALEETKAWRVEFELKDKTTNGGGLTYIIDKETGKILARQVTQ